MGIRSSGRRGRRCSKRIFPEEGRRERRWRREENSFLRERGGEGEVFEAAEVLEELAGSGEIARAGGVLLKLPAPAGVKFRFAVVAQGIEQEGVAPLGGADDIVVVTAVADFVWVDVLQVVPFGRRDAQEGQLPVRKLGGDAAHRLPLDPVLEGDKEQVLSCRLE